MSKTSQMTARIAAGDRDAFAAFLDEYGPRVVRLARRYAQSEADAEDLTQEIFLDLYRCIGGFRGHSQLSTWVYRVALNHCLRHREKWRGADSYDEEQHQSADQTADPARHAARRELSGQVHDALDSLTEMHRTVVVLHELHGLTYTVCAAILGVPVGTVKSRLSNAFRALRSSLSVYVLGDDAVSTNIPAHCAAVGENS
jgi:RNA polymerase sigma-70 factor (ECF subfamily)